MRQRRITGHQNATEILSDHFRCKPSYYAYRPAGTGDWLLIYTLDGMGRIGFEGGETTLRRGEAVLYRPGAHQEYETAPGGSRWEILWAHFQPRTPWLDWLDWPAVAEGIGVIRLPRAGRRDVEQPLRDMVRRGRSVRQRSEAFSLNALELALLQIDRHNPAGAQSGMDPRLGRAIEACSQDLRRHWTVQTLASVATMSPSRFAHRFSEETGTTPLKFVEKQRLARASQLLRGSALSIKEIAHDVGFASPFYFSLRFKRETGLNPRAYRQRAEAV